MCVSFLSVCWKHDIDIDVMYAYVSMFSIFCGKGMDGVIYCIALWWCCCCSFNIVIPTMIFVLCRRSRSLERFSWISKINSNLLCYFFCSNSPINSNSSTFIFVTLYYSYCYFLFCCFNIIMIIIVVNISLILIIFYAIIRTLVLLFLF